MSRTIQIPMSAAADEHARSHRPGGLANHHIHSFVDDMVRRCLPEEIYWFNGSCCERKKLLGELIREQLAFPRRDSFVFPSTRPLESGQAYDRPEDAFAHCMAGRTMYVVPFAIGPADGAAEQFGVQITDSIHVALGIGLITCAGDAALRKLADCASFIRCVHSIGNGGAESRAVWRRPMENAIWSFGNEAGAAEYLSLSEQIARVLGWPTQWISEKTNEHEKSKGGCHA